MIKCFSSLPEARNWLEDAKYADKHDENAAPSDMTVDAWFEYWLEYIVGNLAPNTRRNGNTGDARSCVHQLPYR
jgi:hypothetical protein